MPDEETKALQEKAHGFIDNPFLPFLEEKKLDGKKAALRLSQELNAKEVKTIKIKGAVNPEDLPKGFKIIATSGLTGVNKKGERWYGDGETIIEYNPVAGGIRQNARQDLVMYLGLKPADKVKGDFDHHFPNAMGIVVQARQIAKDGKSSDSD